MKMFFVVLWVVLALVWMMFGLLADERLDQIYYLLWFFFSCWNLDRAVSDLD
jgi:hypothetical protein